MQAIDGSVNFWGLRSVLWPGLIHHPKPESLLPNRCFTDRYAPDDSLLRRHLELWPIQRWQYGCVNLFLRKCFVAKKSPTKSITEPPAVSVVILMTQ